VYEGTQNIQTEIAFPGKAILEKAVDETGRLRVTGTFRYQACDDKTCYLPVTVPVSWAFRFDNFIEPRAPEAIQHKPPAVPKRD
jgi:hypothetical protein